MVSLVLELQRDALDKAIPTADLLRKALVVARKLKVHDIVEWLNHELNGYGDLEVPAYRKLRGELKVFNPYNGWISLRMSNSKHADLLAVRGTSQPISELEQVANGDSLNIYVKLPHKIEQSLMKGMEVPMEPAVLLSKTQIHGLLDRVRNTVLDWALGLEEQGITGDGMSFSSEEQKQAGNVTFNVGNLGNLIGSMQDSQFQQGTRNSSQSYSKSLDLDVVARLITEIRGRINEANLSPDNEAQLRSEISTIESQLAAPKPNVGIIKECLQSTRSILEGVASSALFQGIVVALGALI